MANVGVVCTARGKLNKNRLDLRKLLADALCAEGLSNAAVLARGSGMAATRMLPRLVYGNILLIGDAAGLTSALHGGGIDMACLSGALAVSAVTESRQGVNAYKKKLAQYLREKNALEKVTIRKMRILNFDQFDNLLDGVTARGKIRRLKTALLNPDMFYATLKWFGTKKSSPDWPV